MKFQIPKIKIVHPGEVNYARSNLVPPKLEHFISDMNNSCAQKKADLFRGRDKEITQIFNSLQKTVSPNVILLGENGVGKSAIVQSMIYRILRGDCPKDLKDYHFIFWDIEKTLAILTSESSRMRRMIDEVFEFLISYTNIVIVVDKIHLMAKSTLLLYYLSTILRLPNVKLIGITTEDYFYQYFQYDKKMLSMVDIIPVYEPKPKKIYSMTCRYIKSLEKIHNVKISEDIVKYTISVSSAFDSELRNPGLSLNFIEKSMIVAKQKGHNKVTKEDVNSNFNFNYELFNQMSNEDKKIIAYHEAGHFLVSKLSENIRNYKTTAITIIPSDYFLGITLFEFEMEKQTSCDIDYYIDSIAIDLAGRIAEQILQQENKKAKLTSGAASDLRNATITAREIITKYGMIEECGQNMTYFCNYDLSDLALLSNEMKQLIDQETKKLIDLAYDRAKEILTNNVILLHLIAKELLQNEVLDEKELDNLCKQAKETKTS